MRSSAWCPAAGSGFPVRGWANSAATVTTVASLDSALSIAVTTLWLSAAFSRMVSGVSSNITVGATSSSSIVTVRRDGTGRPFSAVPVTSTRRAGLDSRLSTAVIRTLPLLHVVPAAIVSVVPCWAKSAANAGETAAAVTRTVVSVLKG